MLWFAKSSRVWLLGLLFLVLLSSSFLFTLGKITNTSLISQLLHKEEIIANAQAGNISTFFADFGDSIAVLAQLKNIEGQDEKSQFSMDVFVQQWADSELIGGVVLTDKKGIVVLNSTVSETREIGSDLSDRDYFIWAIGQKEEGDYFIGKPVISRLGASKGKVIVPVASPVFRDGEFIGIVAASVRLRPLTSRFIGLMKTSDETTIYLTDTTGSLIFNSSKVGELGPNIFDYYLKDLKLSVNLTKRGSVHTKNLAVAFSPVELNEQDWSLITTTPVDFEGLYRQIYIKLGLLLFLVVSSLLLFGVVVVEKLKLDHLSQTQNKL